MNPLSQFLFTTIVQSCSTRSEAARARDILRRLPYVVRLLLEHQDISPLCCKLVGKRLLLLFYCATQSDAIGVEGEGQEA